MFRRFHLIASLVLAAALLPALAKAGLPANFAWRDYFSAYWIALGFQSLMLVILLWVLQFPKETARAIAHPGPSVPFPVRQIIDVVIPAAYLFCGFVLVFGYNEVIAALRFTGRVDATLNWLDARMMGGITVPAIAHWGVAHLPSWNFTLMEVIYFGMFPQVGACIAILALRCDRGRALDFVGAILTAYFAALACFWLLPATGPYFVCPDHSAAFPANSSVLSSQTFFTSTLLSLRGGSTLRVIGLDYYVAFPCMHIVQPLIVLWFLRPWRRMVAMLAVYDIALIAAILLLEQHYVVDILGGIAVAALVIAACRHFLGQPRETSSTLAPLQRRAPRFLLPGAPWINRAD